MPTHAELSAKLLSDASSFFQTLYEENTDAQPDMENNAQIFARMSQLLLEDPNGESEGQKYKDIAANMMERASSFFRSVGQTNPPIEEQMSDNAQTFEQLAQLLRANPDGVIEE